LYFVSLATLTKFFFTWCQPLNFFLMEIIVESSTTCLTVRLGTNLGSYSSYGDLGCAPIPWIFLFFLYISWDKVVQVFTLILPFLKNFVFVFTCSGFRKVFVILSSSERFFLLPIFGGNRISCIQILIIPRSLPLMLVYSTNKQFFCTPKIMMDKIVGLAWPKYLKMD